MAAERFIVVVGIDFSDPGDRALEKALELAGAREGGEVHVLHVEQEGWLGRVGASPRVEASAEAALRQIEEHAAHRVKLMQPRLGRLQRVVAHFRHGSPAESITQLASELDADLVVVGSNGHRGFGLFLGSVAEQVVRLARCPVWIARPKNHAGRDARARTPSIAPPSSGTAKKPDDPTGRSPTPPRYAYATNGICAAEATVYDATPPA
jgi:nucleotide-binding universal stress UspA family protein